MTFLTARNAIQSHINTEWTTLRPTVPIVWDNLEADVQGAPFVRVAVEHSSSQQTALGDGARRWRQFGQIVVGVFVPAGTGPLLATELVDDVTTMLRSRTIGGLVITRSPSPLNPIQEGAWWITNVLTDFFWDDAE